MTQFVEVFVVFALLLAVLFWRNHGFHTCRNHISQDAICVRLLSQAKIGKQRVEEETGNSREMMLFPVSSSIRHFPVFVRRSNKRACCPRFLSPCPLKDGTFPNHFKSQKTQFLQLFRPLSPIASPHKPPSFSPFQGAFFAVEVPTQIPRIFPVIHSFRGILRGQIPNQLPAHPPSYQPFQGKSTGRF